MNSKKKAALGRGLGALLQNDDEKVAGGSPGYMVGAVTSIRIDYIEANPFQPRTEFEKEALAELAESIREQGIIQPVTVRRMGHNRYQLISGERRLRASQLAGLQELPAYIRMANDTQMLEMALVENIQRSDLNAMEIAFTFQRLLEECDLTQEVLAERMGKQRTTITNYLRLLKLPAEVQVAIRDGQISMGHARALISIESDADKIQILDDIIKEELSVRAVEKIVRLLSKADKPGHKALSPTLPPHIEKLRDDAVRATGAPVNIRRNRKGKGSITITFASDDELRRIIGLLEQK